MPANKIKYFIIVLLLMSFATFLEAGISVRVTPSTLDLNNPDQYLTAFMKTRGSLDGKPVVYYWSGEVYSFVPGQEKQMLFNFEGFNIGKLNKVENGYELLTREAAFYENPKTGDILENWDNPLNGKAVDVVHVWNDPVNQDMSFPPEYKSYIKQFLPSDDLGDMVVFYLDIFPFYDSPLPRAKYPQYSQSDKYQAAELFQFFVDKGKLLDLNTVSVPAYISWTRFSPWMPFMEMGDAPGNLMFVCRGKKLEHGFDDLPFKIKEYVKSKHPEYQNPPDTFTEPNETSWTYFKKLLEKK
ncbi:MAG TPA: DUF1838 family protein [Candidatus Cloacimonadota bacterium]|nr:DUF1838 family protein [Candidatus Cloacimonadota bacterium]HPT71198.1 DUF1838 family protein [Candidatus Cloacimonadota bacterium]